MEKSTDFNKVQGSKKSQKQKNADFRVRHYRIEISFNKEPGRDLNSKSEYDILLKNASVYSKNIARFIKDCALEPRIRVVEKQSLFNEKMYHELHKIGININQIAYKINAKIDHKEFPDFENTLLELKVKINELLEIIRSK